MNPKNKNQQLYMWSQHGALLGRNWLRGFRASPTLLLVPIHSVGLGCCQVICFVVYRGAHDGIDTASSARRVLPEGHLMPSSTNHPLHDQCSPNITY
eukprot:1058310-Amphidinium_carterae.1